MRTDLMLVAVAALALTVFDHEETGAIQLAQTGPVPTSVVNPRLGAPPPGGHLGEMGRATGVLPPAGAGVVPPGSVVPGNPGARVGTIDGGHLGAPGTHAVPNAPGAGVPPPAAGAVRPPMTGAVPPAAGAVPPTAAGAVPPATGLGR